MLGRGATAAGAQTVAPAATQTPAPTAVTEVPAAPTAAPEVAEAVVKGPGGTIDIEKAKARGVSPEVLRLALSAIHCATTSGAIEQPPTLTLIDYSKPSTEPRLWVFDLVTGDILFTELVAHGKNTGENMARRFSDNPNSLESSIGLFRTADTYTGHNGYSLRLDGLEPGFNAHARDRAIVMHGAAYVNASAAATQGRSAEAGDARRCARRSPPRSSTRSAAAG